jgi:putative drug exporter of the RND superfamily
VFGQLGALMARARWIVIGGWALVALLGLVLGGAVFGRAADVASLGPQAESMAAKRQVHALKPEGEVITALVLGVGPYQPSVVANITKIGNQLLAVPGVSKVDDLYHGHGQIGADNASSLVRVTLTADLPQARRYALEDRVSALLHRIEAPRVLVTSDELATRAFTDQATSDAATGESIALVAVLVALVIIFGGFAGAGIPLAVALVSVAAGLLGLLGLSAATTVSQYAVNVVTLFGIGLAIDYSILLVFRFREERAAQPDADPVGVIGAASAPAGRAVLVSGVAVTTAMAGLYAFGEPLLASMALGGAVVVALATAVALTLVPALLAVFGHRIPAPGEDTWVSRSGRALRQRWSRAAAGRTRPASRSRGPAAGRPRELLGRLAAFAQRAPRAVAGTVTVALLLLSALLFAANYGNSDARAMPASMEVRQAYDAMQTEFANHHAAPVTVVAQVDPASADLRRYLNQLNRTGRIQQLSLRPDIPAGYTVIDLTPSGSTGGPASRDLVREVRRLAAPFPTVVGGLAAELVDYQDSVRARLPLVLLVLVLVMVVLLAGLTGSVVIPLKALLLNLLTLGATLGVLVVLFQWGWGGWLFGFTSWGAVDLTTPLLLFVFIFGLTMDYEVFLLARITEERRAGRSNDAAVLAGITRTSRVVTSAALCITLVFAGFVLGSLTAVKEVGVGMAVAILLDVTVVRGLLLPAVMTLLGELNWWAPPWLHRARTRMAQVPAALHRSNSKI